MKPKIFSALFTASVIKMTSVNFAAKKTFNDVSTGNWAYNALSKLNGNISCAFIDHSPAD